MRNTKLLHISCLKNNLSYQQNIKLEGECLAIFFFFLRKTNIFPFIIIICIHIDTHSESLYRNTPYMDRVSPFPTTTKLSYRHDKGILLSLCSQICLIWYSTQVALAAKNNKTKGRKKINVFRRTKSFYLIVYLLHKNNKSKTSTTP